jgi:hypothetical protein
MAQARNGFGFTVEAIAQLRIARKMFGKNFDGDRTVEARVACAVDLTHASSANRREDLVGA